MPVGKSSIIRATAAKQEKPEKALTAVVFNKCYAETDFESVICKKTIEKADDKQAKAAEKYGIIQPVILWQKEENKFELLGGEESYYIAKQLQLKKLPSVVITCSETEAKDISKALVKAVKAAAAEKETKAVTAEKETSKTVDKTDKKELPYYLL